jgi:hypothetical protein
MLNILPVILFLKLEVFQRGALTDWFPVNPEKCSLFLQLDLDCYVKLEE